eukprot:TRINITY_DN22485_c0_g1_i1.p1 TRINITY_DN22485_c0_g1~~TRINITY_DN22485_c0_g1_i1.p1  ORF type:complete len:380 (+),score=174.17 TRINITY_DN22485_c0_g1_i1:54-1142(+)
MAQDPLCEAFTYCLIKADVNEPVTEHNWDGKGTDKQLRDGLAAYFKSGFTTGQQQSFQDGMKKQVEDNEKRGRVGQAPAPAAANVAHEKVNEIPQDIINSTMLQQGSTEIVPVIYPDVTNGFKGVSLYIDSVGRYKDLPLNDRASKMAQRDIRGDAFVLSSYDDPIKDDWARITCTKDQIEGYIATPPVQAADPQARAAAMQASMQTQEVKPEDVAKAKATKDEANEAFKKGDHAAAEKKYTEGLGLLLGRTDNLDLDDYTQIKHTLFLNRAQARLKLRSFNDAAADCAQVLKEDPAHVKGLYRHATALRGMHDYEACLEILAHAKKCHPADAAFQKLAQEVEVERVAHKKAEKAKFGKMFA